jgi:hypothetical protein
VRKTIAALATVAAAGALAGSAEAATLPVSFAKTKAVNATKAHFRNEGMQVRSVRATSCKRLSSKKVRCGTWTEAYDDMLGGDVSCRAQVTVQIIFGNNVDTIVRNDICY